MTDDARTSPALTALAVTLLLALVIGALTLAPAVTGTAVPGSDKTHHFIAFFTLSLPLAYARPRLAPWVVLAAIAYGAAIELIQPLVGRDGDLLDLLADAAGSALGAGTGAALAALRSRRG